MKVYLECISTPTADTTGASFVLHFESKRYIFGNIHEGFQRAALEQGIRFSKVSDIFLTGKTEWRATGGVIGFILTLSDVVRAAQEEQKQQLKKTAEKLKAAADANGALSAKRIQLLEPEIPRLALHGGPNLAQTIATGRRFIFRQGMPIDVHEHYEAPNEAPLEPTWQDDLVRVWAMPIAPSGHLPHKRSPSKRSFHEFLEKRDEAPEPPLADPNAAPDSEGEKSNFLQRVVKDMFESDWRMDALFETNLRELKLPATVFVRNPETKAIQKYNEHIADDPTKRPDIDVLVRRPWPGALVDSLPRTQPSPVSMSYIVRTYPVRGKFQKDKAKALNIRPGTDYSRLAQGETITLEDGTKITPDQVLGPARPGSGFLISEIPSVDHLVNFLSRPELSEDTIMDNVKAMIWILGPGVCGDSRLQDYIQTHKGVKHVIASPEYNANNLVFESAGAATIRHACIDPHRYDIPQFSNVCKALPIPVSGSLVAERGMLINFEPSFELKTGDITKSLNTGEVLDNMPHKVNDLAKEAQNAVTSKDFEQTIAEQQIPGAESEIITLGTGSAMPSKYRNVSATLLRVPGVGSYLFDCGENTLGQLSRMYSPEQLNALLRDLKMIWISHLHADHHLGTTSMIKAWHEATRPAHEENAAEANRGITEQLTNPAASLKKPGQLFIASDEAMIHWLREYSEIEDFGAERTVLLDVKPANKRTYVRWLGQEVGFASEDPAIVDAFRSATGLADFAACYVPHCRGAQGVALTFPDGFKVTYSGDTRPARSLVDIGQNSTVLIHEATFDDERTGDARAKNHSTTSQAINVGRKMNAKRVVLTHFSQRYTKIPVMSDLKPQEVDLVEPEEVDPDAADAALDNATAQPAATPASESGEPAAKEDSRRSGSRPSSSLERPMDDIKVAVAFDSMRVKVKDIIALEKFTPALMALYDGANSNLKVTEEQKAKKLENHRKQKIERKAEQRMKQQAGQNSRPPSSQGERSLPTGNEPPVATVGSTDEQQTQPGA